MPKRYLISPLIQRLLLTGGVGFLLLTNILFFAGWLQPIAAIPLILLAIGGACSVVRDSESRFVPCSGKDAWALILTALGVLLTVEMISFHGHLPQLGDFFARNPIYNVLVRCDWPLYSAQGEYFVYYAAYWLPPALIAKLAPGLNPAHFLFLWTLLGLLLSFALLFIRLRARVLPLFLILLLLGSLDDLFGFPGLAWRARFDERWALIQYITDTFHSAIIFPNWLKSLMQTFNHAVPMMLAASLIWSRLVPVRHMPFIAATAVICSPIGSIGLFLLLLLSMGSWLRRKGHIKKLCCTPSLWCGLVLLLFIGWYYSANSCSSGLSFATPRWSEGWKVSLLRASVVYLCSIGAFWLPFLLLMLGGRAARYARTPLFKAALFLSVFVSFFWVGLFNNELMFKASFFVFLFLALLLSGWWRHTEVRRRRIFLLFLVVYSACFLKRGVEFLTDWSCSPDVIERHMRNEWEGHLNHPESWGYPPFWGKEAPGAPALWYTEEGASAQTLLAPVATGRKCSEMGREKQAE